MLGFRFVVELLGIIDSVLFDDSFVYTDIKILLQLTTEKPFNEIWGFISNFN